jgi:DNA-binding NarL/FixJ family response regulator
VAEIRIMLVDDFSQWRATARSILERIDGCRVVGEAKDAMEAIEKVSLLLPDIVLLDIGMPMLSGIEAAPRIRRASPASNIIFLTQESNSDIRVAALATGARGYVLKSRVITDLEPAIHAALRMIPASCLTEGIGAESNQTSLSTIP